MSLACDAVHSHGDSRQVLSGVHAHGHVVLDAEDAKESRGQGIIAVR